MDILVQGYQLFLDKSSAQQSSFYKKVLRAFFAFEVFTETKASLLVYHIQ